MKRLTQATLCVLILTACDNKTATSSESALATKIEMNTAEINSIEVEKVNNVAQLIIVDQISENVSTYCKANEVTYINTKINKIERNPSKGIAYKLTPTNNRLSMCLAKDNSYLSYRYGNGDTVTLENQTTTELPFGRYYQQIGRLGKDILFFSNGAYYYYVGISGGMGRGISIDVFKGDELIAELFSGNTIDEDFFLAPNVTLPSALFSEKKPLHKKMQ
ncbi:hypothetical protein [Shewanella livingstonensis]|uniref:Lipoprotein n=1 Tax=Shewanella livingstonensis TaxID=150120 RepID=A0A3G8LQT6_9GAMM|nr:hypothetical protein [Shewanella livingstonensis]AZG72143.1 hypothetical protein EGC82_04810 [Shewanella livingstonensis]